MGCAAEAPQLMVQALDHAPEAGCNVETPFWAGWQKLTAFLYTSSCDAAYGQPATSCAEATPTFDLVERLADMMEIAAALSLRKPEVPTGLVIKNAVKRSAKAVQGKVPAATGTGSSVTATGMNEPSLTREQKVAYVAVSRTLGKEAAAKRLGFDPNQIDAWAAEVGLSRPDTAGSANAKPRIGGPKLHPRAKDRLAIAKSSYQRTSSGAFVPRAQAAKDADISKGTLDAYCREFNLPLKPTGRQPEHNWDTILAYARKHGCIAASKRFPEVARKTIYQRAEQQKRLDARANPNAPSSDFKVPAKEDGRRSKHNQKEIVKYLRENGYAATAKRFPEVKRTTMYGWKRRDDLLAQQTRTRSTTNGSEPNVGQPDWDEVVNQRRAQQRPWW